MVLKRLVVPKAPGTRGANKKMYLRFYFSLLASSSSSLARRLSLLSLSLKKNIKIRVHTTTNTSKPAQEPNGLF